MSLALLGSLAAGIGSQFAGSILANKQAKENQQRSLQQQAMYDYWHANTIYPKIQEMDYDLAKRYAENSASWEVQGLKAAGLNPILAASKGVGGAGVDYSSPSSSSGSVPQGVGGFQARGIDAAEAIRDLSSAKMSDVQAKVANDTAASLVSSAKSDAALKAANVDIAKATRAKIEAERDQINANTARTIFESKKLEDSGGLKSPILHDISVGASRLGLNPLVNVEKSASSAKRHSQLISTLHDLSQYIRSGGFFGDDRSRIEVVLRDMEKKSKK